MTTQVSLMENYSIPTNASDVGTAPWIIDLRIALYSILLVFSLVGNVLIIAVVLCNKSLRTEFNYLIINMAVSDLTVPLLALPLEIAEILYKYEWIADGALGNVLCKTLYFLIDISAPVSVLSLVAIAINRFFASVYPVRRKMMSSKMTKVLLLMAWMVPILFYSPHFYRVKLSNNTCTYSWEPWLEKAGNEQANSIYLKLNVVLFFIGPLIAITILYSLVIFKLRKSTRSLSKMLNDNQLQQRKRINRHIFHMSVVIIIAFALLWGPFEAFLFILSCGITSGSTLEKALSQYGWIVQLLGYSTVVVNPVTCFGFLKNYRRGLKNVIILKSKKFDEETNVNFGKRTTIYTRVDQVGRDREATLLRKHDMQETVI